MAYPDGAGWHDFLTCSERIGRDISLVQAAGGNSSIKTDGRMWIKASGTWLSEAVARPIMVPVDLHAMRARVMAGELDEGEIAGMTGSVPGMEGMRASVETPFHALMDAPCVLHVHCVATLAHAISAEAESRLATRLQGLDWLWQPYIKPGVPLTNALREAGAAGSRVVVLGSHGLIVAGRTPSAAEARLREIRKRLQISVTGTSTGFRPLDISLAGTGYGPANIGHAHALAQDEALIAIAGECAIAPDFVVFFGPRIPVLSPGPDLPAALTALARQPVPLNAAVIVEGHGVLIRDIAMRGTAELLRGYHLALEQFLADGGGERRVFSEAEIDELLGWDAEKYRQKLNRGGGDGAV